MEWKLKISRKPKQPGKACTIVTWSTTNPTWIDLKMWASVFWNECTFQFMVMICSWLWHLFLSSILLFSQIFSSLMRYRSRYSDCLQAGRPRNSDSSPVGSRIVTSPHRPDRLWDPPSVYRELLPRGGQRQRREADHSPPTVPRSRKRGSIRPLPHTPSWRSA
jgi:hypothetical protein